MLEQGRVRIDGEVCKLAHRSIQAGQIVSLGAKTTATRLVSGLEIIFEDDDILVVHKPAGLLTVATPHEKERTVYSYLRKYLKQRGSAKRPFIVHRLDKFVSGLLVFAKSAEMRRRLQLLFKKHDVQRKYWAIVEGQITKGRGTIRSLLAEDRSRRMHSTQDRSIGKVAVTHFRVLRRVGRMT